MWYHVAFFYEIAAKMVKLYVADALDGWVDEVRVMPRLLGSSEFLHVVPYEGTLLKIK